MSRLVVDACPRARAVAGVHHVLEPRGGLADARGRAAAKASSTTSTRASQSAGERDLGELQRMFTGATTAPAHVAAEVFVVAVGVQARIATRSPGSTPRACSPAARRAMRSTDSAWVLAAGGPSRSGPGAAEAPGAVAGSDSRARPPEESSEAPAFPRTAMVGGVATPERRAFSRTQGSRARRPAAPARGLKKGCVAHPRRLPAPKGDWQNPVSPRWLDSRHERADDGDRWRDALPRGDGRGEGAATDRLRRRGARGWTTTAR